MTLPTEQAPAGFTHGWFSEKQAKTNGTSFYETQEGGSQEISMVSESPNPTNSWDDLKYVGLLRDNCLGDGRPSSQLTRDIKYENVTNYNKFNGSPIRFF